MDGWMDGWMDDTRERERNRDRNRGEGREGRELGDGTKETNRTMLLGGVSECESGLSRRGSLTARRAV